MQRSSRGGRGSGNNQATPSSLVGKISEFTIRRLSSYYRILLDLEGRSTNTISSARLARLCGVTSAQVRKDLSYFGNFGTRGLGYQVVDLKSAIEKILGLDKKWTMALFGAGSLGHALFFHRGFRDDGFFFTHLFDVDPEKVGDKWRDVEIRPFEDAKDLLKAEPVDIGVIATPNSTAQHVVDILVETGVSGILNFAPRQLIVPKRVGLRNVNLAVALESLSFFLSR
ncbi:MAG: redox-sensing transcriptional repressor Rex [Candidatus Krumholzibacteriia bacterium]